PGFGDEKQMSSEDTENAERITGHESEHVTTPPQKRRNVIIWISLTIAVIALVTWGIIRIRDQKTPGQGTQAAANSPGAAQALTVIVTTVISQDLNRQARLPGELQANQDVAIYPKVQSFVEWIGVDRGSVVKAGQLLARMSAPELQSQSSEAGAKAKVAQ